MSPFVPLSNLTQPKVPWLLRRKEIAAVSPSRVWRALTDPRELTLWWCDAAEVDLRPGGRYAFWGSHVYADEPSQEARGRGFEIIDLVPESRLEFRWWIGDAETRVLYELVNYLEQTEITVIQTAEKAPAWDPGSGMPSWWWVALPALRSYVERGEAGLRIDYAASRDTPEITLSTAVSTFPWIVWHKLTDPRELERWWARKAEVDLHPGGAFRLGLETMGPRKVLELEEGKRLVLDWAWKEGTLGRVEWLVQETDDDTRLSVKDSGSWDPSTPRDAYLIYWAAAMRYLKQMSERGITPREYQDVT